LIAGYTKRWSFCQLTQNFHEVIYVMFAYVKVQREAKSTPALADEDIPIFSGRLQNFLCMSSATARRTCGDIVALHPATETPVVKRRSFK
jgi:hypothetical protein